MAGWRFALAFRSRTVTLAVGPSRRTCAGLCLACGGTLLTPDEAATVAGTTVRELVRRADAGDFHTVDAPDGRLWVCARSLSPPLLDG